MTENINVEEESVPEQSQNPFINGIRRVLLASIGAMTVAQGEAEKFVGKLIEQGEIAEKDGRALLNELAQKRNQRAQESSQRVSKELERRMESILSRMNMPTKSEIDRLTQKVSELSQKVDALRDQNEA